MKNKKWEFTKPKKDNSWSIFKIMGEFVEGYEKLSAIGPCISFFGSARTKADNKYYKLVIIFKAAHTFYQFERRVKHYEVYINPHISYQTHTEPAKT